MDTRALIDNRDTHANVVTVTLEVIVKRNPISVSISLARMAQHVQIPTMTTLIVHVLRVSRAQDAKRKLVS
jgi:hypothetical protein